jgi:hypothetical protein
MIVVSNAGPIVALSRINHLFVLPALYETILIPQAVRDELTAREAPGAAEPRSAEWLQQRRVDSKTAVSLLRERLDAGESEAIVLALDLEADILLMDEARGRRIAKSRNLSLTGTLGVLLLAKERGHIDRVAPLLDALEQNAFRMSPSLRAYVLQQAGEDDVL